jgi:negative regulator of flagellin synthesis FlgM
VIKQYGENSKPKKSEQSSAPHAARQSDAVILSKQAISFQQVQKTLKEIPDVREAKVNEVREQIRSGSYNVSGTEIAEQILARTLVDRSL